MVAVVGDGSLTGGMAYEALNNLGHSHQPVVIILNVSGRVVGMVVDGVSDVITLKGEQIKAALAPLFLGGERAGPAADGQGRVRGPFPGPGRERGASDGRERRSPGGAGLR